MRNLDLFIIFIFILSSCDINHYKPEHNLIVEGKSIGAIELGKSSERINKDARIGCIYNKDSICIELYTDNITFKTTKGIKVGDDVSKVYKTYGNNYKNTDLLKGNISVGEFKNIIIYENIKFLINNDTIKKIAIY